MRTFLRALVVFVGLGAACKGNPKVGLELTLPHDAIGETFWFEVGAYRDATCAAIGPMLDNGVPEGFTARVAFRRDDKEAPVFGDIPNARYAFGAVARNETCAVVATGCREANVGATDKVAIRLETLPSPTGKCAQGASCQAGKCIPANDNSDPSVGAGCSLELLGAGPLVFSPEGEDTIISAPAIAATSTGFLIVYREVDPIGSSARLILLPIDLGGGALHPERPGLPARCGSTDENDGVGLVVKPEDGSAMITLARPACTESGALELLNVKTTNDAEPGRPVIGKFVVSTTASPSKMTLGAARPAAMRPGGALVVFSERGTGRIAMMDPEKGITPPNGTSPPNGTFGGKTGITDAWIAASDKVLALLAAGTGPAATPVDGGADPVAPDNEPTLRLLMVPSNMPVEGIVADPPTPRAPIFFPGSWASIAAVGGRVIVLSDGTGPSRSVSYRAFDLDRDNPSDTGGFSLGGSAKVTAGDVTILGDRAYFAALKEGSVALHVYNNATTTLTPLAQRSFELEPRISAINTVRDGRVSVAATDTRVAVVWTTAKVLGRNDGAGGYAVFGCTK